MQSITLLAESLDHTRRIAEVLAGELRPRDVVLLTGDLGAGKTTFTKAVCAALGVSEQVTSPTFNLVHEYKGRALTVCHADLYRLERTGELVDLGLDDARRAGAVSIVEWGDLAPREFPEALVLAFTHAGDDARRIEVSWRGSAWELRFLHITDQLLAAVSA